MAKLVIGTDKTNGTPALVKEVGIIPTGTLSITTNGTYDVTNYASADVNTPAAPAHYIEKAVDANGKLINGSTFINLNGVTDIDSNVLAYQYHSSSISGNISFGSVTGISGGSACLGMFVYCQYITGVDLSNVETVSGYASCQDMFKYSKITTLHLGSLKELTGGNCFYNICSNCNMLSSVNLGSLIKITGYAACQQAFDSCTALTSIDLSSLVTLGTSDQKQCRMMFTWCGNLINVDLSSFKIAKTVTGCEDMFVGTKLTTLSFPALKIVSSNTVFNNMLGAVTGCTVHFPSNMQSVIGSWTSVVNGFGGTNTTVLFDLPATNILTGANSVSYERNPKYDTATALAWRVQDGGTETDPIIDWTPYYTNGTTDPVVSDTIYSDAACTTAVTTISSIA